jgi:hypothetical protein
MTLRKYKVIKLLHSALSIIIKEKYKGREDEEEDLRCYWMILSKYKVIKLFHSALSLIIKRKIDGTLRRGRIRKQLLDDLKEVRRYWKKELGSTRSLCIQNSLQKRLWTCRRRDYMLEMTMVIIYASAFRCTWYYS